ncbi:hypothetical protein M427DRAFT_209960 [Gonapodya prolifera JEL478]|uniref:Uncharacterized protein n=1 Tax=Gonapodya prolifera (strain JEL478) TaxID=1344416 RepID=A0A139ANS4_GONPJ|nr:hypothetical protein M427DRAFT_209960 [Gonapodya prolifera JEL478]|eukprot:KXS18407.1 hypothetical protein M427DRAFT_209960 [Gonapodya prolifera JEL478]
MEWFLRVDETLNRGMFSYFNIKVLTPPYISVCVRFTQPQSHPSDTLPPQYNRVFSQPALLGSSGALLANADEPALPPAVATAHPHRSRDVDDSSPPPLHRVEDDAGSLWRVHRGHAGSQTGWRKAIGATSRQPRDEPVRNMGWGWFGWLSQGTRIFEVRGSVGQNYPHDDGPPQYSSPPNPHSTHAATTGPVTATVENGHPTENPPEYNLEEITVSRPGRDGDGAPHDGRNNRA